MDRDRAAERTLRLVGGATRGEAPWNPAARAAEVWEADVVPFPGRFRDEPDRVAALALVGASGFVLHCDVVSPRPDDAAGRAHAVADAVLKAARQVGVLPPTVHVRDPALADALRPELQPRGAEVEAAEMPELDEAIRSSLENLTSEGAAYMTSAETWRETESAPDEVAEFHAIAAAFFRAEPWRAMGDNSEPIIFVFPDGSTFLGAVRGEAGMEFGLSLYSNPEDLADLYGSDEDEPLELLRRMKGWTLTVTFERRSTLPRAMQREIAAAGWEVAGADAYPMLYGLRLPGFRVAAEHVRTMTAALAGAVLLAGGDEAPPLAGEIMERTGLQAGRFRDEDDLPPWPELEEAHPIGPVGPNADPEAALRHVWSSGLAMYEGLRVTELDRVRRFERWLSAQGLSKAARRRHLRNARVWSEYLAGMEVPAPAATEYDLRSYLYDWFPRKESVPRDVERALPESLRLFFRWLQAEEGIGYPWAGVVLDEFPDVARARGEAPEGMFWEDDVQDWRGTLWQDLDARVMLHDRELPGTEEGWPAMMNADIAHLHAELERRWLIWYDEVVSSGVTALDLLYDTLAERQRRWENTPHAQVGGRTPRQVVAEYEREQAETPHPALADFGGRKS
jgi:hypothetical protein